MNFFQKIDLVYIISFYILIFPIIDGFQTQKQYVVGTIKGKSSVDEGGRSHYDIDIIPARSGGFQPQLSFSFDSSNSGNLLGYGFALKGLSSIHRCPSTIEQDSQIRSVKFDISDRLCIDGHRLVSINGTYGADGAVYRTEVDTFSKIQSFQNSSALTFEMRTAKGQLFQYGFTENSRVMLQNQPGTINFWTLNKIRDTAGNYADFSYQQNISTGEYYPERIDFGGNDRNGAPHHSSIEFLYQPRPDTTAIYQLGSMMQTSQRLIAVSLLNENKVYKQFRLDYTTSCLTGMSMISSIQECDGDNLINSLCMPPTVFQWDEMCVGNWEQVGALSSHVPTISNSIISLGFSRVQIGDFDGNGLTDIFQINGFGSTSSSIYLNFGLGIPYKVLQGPPILIRGTVVQALVDIERVKFVDLNSDGLTDIYVISSYDGTSTVDKVYLMQQDGSYIQVQGIESQVPTFLDQAKAELLRFQFGDFNGDGFVDIYLVNGFGSTTSPDKIYINQGASGVWKGPFPGATNPIRSTLELAAFDISRIMIFDFNGDNLADIYYVTGWGSTLPDKVYLNSGSQDPSQYFSAPPIKGPPTPIGNTIATAQLDKSRLKFGDFNSDGNLDIALIQGNSATPTASKIFMNAGNGQYNVIVGPSFLIRPTISLASIDVNRVRVLDVDGNGAADFYYMPSLNSVPTPDLIYLSTGNMNSLFTPPFNGQLNSISNAVEQASLDMQSFQFGDFDGDGIVDLYRISRCPTTDPNCVDQILVNPFDKPMLTSITDGFGFQVLFAYEPLTNNSIYTKKTQVYPLRAVQSPMRVVSAMSNSDAIGGLCVQVYHYEGYSFHLLGLGSIGFQKTGATDLDTGITAHSEYSRDWKNRLQFQVLSSIQMTQDGTILASVNRTYQVDIFNASSSRFVIFQPLLQSQRFELIGTPISFTSALSSFDEYGNAIQTTTTVVDSTGTLTEIRFNIFENRIDDNQEWMIGLPLQINITTQLNAKKSISRVTNLVHDLETGILVQKTSDPNTSLEITTYFQLDLFGHQISKSINGLRNSTLVYDAQGRFFPQEFNALNQLISRSYHPFFGITLSETDVNNLTTTSTFDSFGILIEQTYPDGTSTSSNRFWCSSSKKSKTKASNNCPPLAVFGEVVISRVNTKTTNFYDSASRQVRTVGFGLNGRTIFQDTQYNHLGLENASSLPYFADLETPQIFWNVFTYDILARKILEIHPDNTTLTYVFNGLQTTTINQLGQKQTRQTNSQGALLISTDQSGHNTVYDYDSQMHRISITDSQNNLVSFVAYDLTGNVIQDQDADRGTWSYTYNSFGELASQIHQENNNKISYQYDLLGRRNLMQTNSETFSWQFDSASNGIGKIHFGSSKKLTQLFQYDNFGRIASKQICSKEFQISPCFTISFSYDSLGRMSQTNYPGDFSTLNLYDSVSSTLTEILDLSTNYSLWTLVEQDALGRTLSESLGENVISVNKTFDQRNGRLLGIESSSTSQVFQSLEYEYNMIGALTIRSDKLKDLQEQFAYDSMNRLIASSLMLNNENVFNASFAFDSIGNIVYKSNVGNYKYGENGVGPHAVSSISDENGNIIKKYAYDSEGNMLNSNGRTIKWHERGIVSQISNGNSNWQAFSSGPDAKMYKRSIESPNLQEETIYFDGVYEFVNRSSDGILTHRYILGNSIMVVKNCANQQQFSTSYVFILNDNLGSPNVLLDQKGNILDERSYDSFGKARNSTTWLPFQQSTKIDCTSSFDLFDGGFTGHLDICEFGLVHMSGRVYDPDLGRFISADPTIPAVENGQALNRYSYSLNSPLNVVDPSGFGFFKKVWHAITHAVRSVAHAVSNVVHAVEHAIQHGQLLLTLARLMVDAAAMAACGGSPQCGIAADAVFSAAVTKIEGGSWKDAIEAGAIDAIELEIGSSGLQPTTRFLLDTSIGATSSLIHGGSLVSGFLQGAGAATGMKSMTSIPAGESVVGDLVKNWASSTLKSEVTTYVVSRIAAKMKMSVDEFDLALEVVSMVGGPRPFDKERGEDNKLITGLLQRGATGFVFDVADVSLAYQGLPTATSWNIILHPSLAATVAGGHSLGSIDALNLANWGIVRSDIKLVALPIFLVAPTGAVVFTNTGDVVAGYGLSSILNPQAHSYSGNVFGVDGLFANSHQISYYREIFPNQF